MLMFWTELHYVIQEQFYMAQYGIGIDVSNQLAVFETDAYIALINELQKNKE